MVALFESYNARFVDPSTVAETFILRDREFSQLCEQNNSLLIGPRGSGKTTLLKMLKVGAQIAWKNRRQSKALRRFRFAPIYVGADRQLDFIVGNVHLNEANRNSLELLKKSLLAFRVKFACAETLHEITATAIRDQESVSHQFVDVSSDPHAVWRSISTVWEFEKEALTYLEVKTSLQSQLQLINKYLNLIKYGETVNVRELINGGSNLAHDPIQACQSFVDAVNVTIGQPDKKWALCIDEIEIMADDLQQYLFSCLRSIDHRIVLKLATSPFSGIDWNKFNTPRPMAGHDFTVINLAYRDKKLARRFSGQLLEAIIGAERGKGADKGALRGRDILGSSPIAEANSTEAQKDAYSSPHGDHYRRFSRLAEEDVAFRQFLTDRVVDLDKLDQLSEKKRAGLRKHIWQVAVRLEYGPTNIFSRPDSSIGSRSPSRKSVSEIYLGYDSLLTICEGNPRTVIGLLRPLVRLFLGTGKRVSASEQARVLEATYAKYFSLLSTIAVSDPSRKKQTMSVVELIDIIGEYFSEEVNGHVFKSEPSLTIRLDRSTPKEYVEAIGHAMNQGAFVMITDESELHDFGSLDNARLRLSYLLSPRYHTPLIVGQAAKLSTVLTKRKLRQAPRTLTADDLFFGISDDEEN